MWTELHYVIFDSFQRITVLYPLSLRTCFSPQIVIQNGICKALRLTQNITQKYLFYLYIMASKNNLCTAMHTGILEHFLLFLTCFVLSCYDGVTRQFVQSLSFYPCCKPSSEVFCHIHFSINISCLMAQAKPSTQNME